MENNELQTEQNNNPKSKKLKTKYIALSAVAVIILISAYFFFFKKKNENTAQNKAKTDSTLIKKDTLAGKTKSDTVLSATDEEEEGNFGNYVYVGNGQVLGEKNLKFGDVLFVDYQKSDENRKVVYLANPYQNSNPPAYSIIADNLVNESSFEDYKNNFSLAPFSGLASSVKDIILKNNYSNGNNYSITQNAERAKSTICSGDFDGDGSKDVAVLLDNNEKQISRLLVICNNAETKKPYIGFAENYNDKMKINSFRKGALIVIDSELEPSDIDGVILKGEDVKLAIIYDKNLQKFKTYYQD